MSVLRKAIFIINNNIFSNVRRHIRNIKHLRSILLRFCRIFNSHCIIIFKKEAAKFEKNKGMFNQEAIVDLWNANVRQIRKIVILFTNHTRFTLFFTKILILIRKVKPNHLLFRIKNKSATIHFIAVLIKEEVSVLDRSSIIR